MPRAPKTLICCFRDPTMRLISLYEFYRRHPEDAAGSELLPLARALSIEKFFDHPHVRHSPEVDNKYLRVFTDGSIDIDAIDADRAASLDLVYDRISCLAGVAITENLQLSADIIAERLGLGPSEQVEKLQVTQELFTSDKPHPKLNLSRSLLELVEPLVKFDRHIYQFAKNRML